MSPGVSEPRRVCGPQPEPQTHGPAVKQLGPESLTVFRPKPHRHDDSTVLVLAAGEGQHRVDGIEHQLRPPQMILLGERQTHVGGSRHRRRGSRCGSPRASGTPW
ncbi:hypothetical protein GCM10009805_08530 [Leucobacter chromiireducens subsp. solipictus]|uniref:AraC family ligand binding domain-containing protein n=1 Tax=Leucobacter chromiireducens TaxID=283877 RepID=UPI0019287E1E